MKPEIENLKVWMSGRSTTGYQRALGMKEFEQLLSYVTELEQLRIGAVSGEYCPICKSDDLVDIDDHYTQCCECGFSFVG